MKLRLGLIVLCFVAMLGWLSPGSISQDGDAPEGCCWLQTWAEAGFMGEDDVVDGPGEWPEWSGEMQSARAGDCATVTLWPKPQFEGEPVVIEPGEQRTDLDGERFESMKIACDG